LITPRLVFFGVKRCAAVLLPLLAAVAAPAAAQAGGDPRASGLMAYSLGQFSQAQASLTRAESQRPDDIVVGNALAMINLVRGRLDLVRSAADRMINVDPRSVDMYLLFAASVRTKNEATEAISRLAAAAPKVLNDTKINVALAVLNLRVGDTTRAVGLLQKAVDGAPNALEPHAVLAALYRSRRSTDAAAREAKALAAIVPERSPERIALADFYVLVGRRDEAKRVLQEIVDRGANRAPALRRLAELAVTDGKFDEALKALEPIFRENVDDIDALILRGQVSLGKHSPADAAKDFQKVLDLRPAMWLARYQLALAEVELHQIPKATSDFAEAHRLEPSFADATVHLADLQIQAREYGAAVNQLTTLIAAQPGIPAAYELLGTAYLNLGKPYQAAQAYGQLVRLVPANSSAYFLWGSALYADNRKDEARKALEFAVTLSPNAYEPVAKLVEISLAEKRVDSAISLVQKHLETARGSAPLHNLLGTLYEEKGQHDRSEAEFLQAIQLDSHLVDAAVHLGKLYALSNRYDKSIATLKSAAAANPGSATLLSVLGLSYQQHGDFANARRAFEQALAVRPRFVLAANNLAWLLSEHGSGGGDMQRAVQLAQAAFEDAPRDPQVGDTFGWILYKNGQFARAFNILKVAAAGMPNDPMIQYHLGLAAANSGNRAEAKAALSRAVNSPANFASREEARKALASLP
jgi:Flp pilus assembly protein TadD